MNAFLNGLNEKKLVHYVELEISFILQFNFVEMEQH